MKAKHKTPLEQHENNGKIFLKGKTLEAYINVSKQIKETIDLDL